MFALSTISKIVLLGIVTDANLTKDVYNDSVEVSPKQLTRSVYAIGMDPGSETNYIDDSMNMEDDLYADDFFDDDEGDEFDDDDAFDDDDDEFDDDDEDGGGITVVLKVAHENQPEADATVVNKESMVNKPAADATVVNKERIVKPEGFDSWTAKEQHEYNTFMATKIAEYEATHEHSHVNNDALPTFGPGSIPRPEPKEDIVTTKEEETNLVEVKELRKSLIQQLGVLSESIYNSASAEETKGFEEQIDRLEKKLAALESTIADEEEVQMDEIDKTYVETEEERIKEEIESTYYMIKSGKGSPEEIDMLEQRVMGLEVQLATFESGGDEEQLSTGVQQVWKGETQKAGDNGFRSLRGKV